MRFLVGPKRRAPRQNDARQYDQSLYDLIGGLVAGFAAEFIFGMDQAFLREPFAVLACSPGGATGI